MSGGENAESSRETTYMAWAESHSEEPKVLSVTVRGKVAVRTQSTRDLISLGLLRRIWLLGALV